MACCCFGAQTPAPSMAVGDMLYRHQPAARPAVQQPPPHQQQWQPAQQQQPRRRPTPADLRLCEQEEMEARDEIFGGASCRRLSLTDGPRRTPSSFAGASTPRLGGRPGGGGSGSSGGSRSHAAALTGFPTGAFAAQRTNLGAIGGSLPLPVGAHAMSFSAGGARRHGSGAAAAAAAASGAPIASCSQDSFFNPLRRVSLPVKGQTPRSFEELHSAAAQFGGSGSPGPEAARAPRSMGDLRQTAAIAAQ